MKKLPLRAVLPLLSLSILLLWPGAAAAWLVEAGWSHADVGLDAAGDGLCLGAGQRLPLGEGPWSLDLLAEYVQKAGSQPRLFVDPLTDASLGDEEIRLHYLQPTVLIGRDLLRRPGGPRPYAGASLALKMGETWTRPVEDGQDPYAYEDIDVVAHLGVSAGVARAVLDFRYSWGLAGQLIVQPTTGDTAAKAADYLPAGTLEPEDGARLSHFQLTATVAF